MTPTLVEQKSHDEEETPNIEEGVPLVLMDKLNDYYCYSAADLIHKFPNPGFLVEKLLPKVGIALFVGAEGVGKTRIVYDLIRAVLRGGPWLGRSAPVQKGGVLLLDHEMGPIMVAQRLRDLDIADVPGERFAIYSTGRNELNEHLTVSAKGHTPPRTLRLPSPEKLDMEDPKNILYVTEEYINLLAERVHASVIVFDSMRQSHMAKENDSHLMGPLMDVFRRLSRRRLVCIIHHVAKGEGGGARGSTEIAAGVDTIIMCQRTEVAWTKIRWEATEHPRLKIKPYTLEITNTTVPGVDLGVLRVEAMVKVLADMGTWMEMKDLRKALGDMGSFKESWNVVDRGVELGLIMRKRRDRRSGADVIGLPAWEKNED